MGAAPSKKTKALLQSLPELGASFDEAQCREIFNVYDTNRNGVLDKEEACKFIQEYYTSRGLNKPDAREVFKLLAGEKTQLELNDLMHPLSTDTAKEIATEKKADTIDVLQAESRLAYAKDEKPVPEHVGETAASAAGSAIATTIPTTTTKAAAVVREEEVKETSDEEMKHLHATNQWEWLSRLKVRSAPKKPLIPGRWTTVRVFLSSTFVDMHGERDCLIKEVFPEINMRLKESFVRVVPVDLRWGVSAEQTNVIQSTCLDEIDNCRTEKGSMPWFLGLRGARYGWVQEKYQEPSSFATPEYLTWLRKYQDMGKKLSITSMEVYHAYVGTRPSVAAQAHTPRSLFLFRNPSFLKEVPDDRKWLFQFEYLPNEEKKNIPAELQMQYSFLDEETCRNYKKDYDDLDSEVKNCTIPSRWFEYPCNYKESRITGKLPNGKMFGVGSVGGLEEFRKFCIDTLVTSIRQEYPEQKSLTREVLESARHASLIEDRAEGFVGREELLNFLLSYCFSSSSKPFKPRVGETTAAAASVWICEACTSENQLDDKICGICETPCPSSSSSSTAAAASAMWTCAMCTTENAATEVECCVCCSSAPPPPSSDVAEGKILVLVGVPGCGKSALVARLSQLCAEKNNNDNNTFLFVHLIGASEDSVSLRAMLTRICAELKANFSFIRNEIPTELDALKEQWHSVFLKQACAATSEEKGEAAAGEGKRKRVVLIIDAINQLLASDDAHEMTWLPSSLPENARVILSTLEHENNTFENTKKLHSTAIVEFVGPLLQKEREDLVSGLLARYHKLLTCDNSNSFLGNQMELVMSKKDAELPLFLVMISDVLRRFGVFEKLTSYIKDLPGTVNSLFEKVLSDIEEEHGVELVRACLSLLAISRGGLMEIEILELLEMKEALGLKETKSNFSVLYGHLQNFFAAGGSGFLRFFHDQIRYTVCDKYSLSKHLGFEPSAHEQQMHSVLGNYFLRLIEEKLNAKKSHQNDEHAVSEVIFHLVRGGTEETTKQARDLLLNMDFLYLKLLFFSVDNLLEDFDSYLRLNQELPIKLLKQAIEMSRFSLTLDAKQISLQLFSKLAYASKEYVDLVNLINPSVWKLCKHPSALLPHVWTGLRKPGGPLISTWVCSRRCQITDVSEPFLFCFPAKPQMRVCLAITDDNLMLMWNITTGTCVHTYKGPFLDTPKRLTFVPKTDQTKVVVTGYRNTMICYDLLNVDNSSNFVSFKFPTPQDNVGPISSELLIFIPGKGVRMLTSSTKGELFVWKLPYTENVSPPQQSGIEPEYILKGHIGSVGFVELATGRTAQNSTNLRWNWTTETESPSLERGDGKIISWDQAGILRLWDLSSSSSNSNSNSSSSSNVVLEPVETYDAHASASLVVNGKPGIIQGALPHRESRRLLSWDHNGWLVDLNLEDSSFQSYKNESQLSATLLDETHVLSWTKSKLHVWDLQKPEQKPASFLGHESTRNVRWASLVPGKASLVASWSADKTIKIWDWKTLSPGEESKTPLLNLVGHTSDVKGVFFLEDGRKLLSWGSDIRVWDLEAKEQDRLCIAVLNGHVGDIAGVRLAGSNLFSWAYDGKILVWDLTKSEVKEDGIHADRLVGIHTLARSPGTTRVATAAADGNVFVWQLTKQSSSSASSASCSQRQTLKAHEKKLTSICLGTAESFLTAGDFTVKVWDRASLNLLHTLACPLSPELQPGQANYLYTPVVQMLQNRVLVTGLGQLCVWDFLKSSDAVCFPCVGTPLSESVVLGTSHREEHTCYWWSGGLRQCSVVDANQPAVGYTMTPDTRLDHAALLLPRDRVVAAVTLSGEGRDGRGVSYWNEAKAISTIFPTSSLVAGLQAVDQEARFVISWSRSGSRYAKEELIVWDLHNSDVQTNHFKLPGHEGDIGGVLLLPGQQAVSWGQDGLLFVWDLSQLDDSKKNRRIAELRGHPRAVKDVKLLPEGLVSWSDVDVRLWSLNSSPRCVWSIFFDASSPAFAVDVSSFPEFVAVAGNDGGFICFS